MSEVYYEVRMTRVLHTVRISNVDRVMFVDRNKRDYKFLSSVKKLRKMFFFFLLSRAVFISNPSHIELVKEKRLYKHYLDHIRRFSSS